MPTTQSKAKPVYDALVAAGCTLDNHESDLYVLDSPEVRESLRQFPRLHFTRFVSVCDGKNWLDIPFMYAPWWAARATKAK